MARRLGHVAYNAQMTRRSAVLLIGLLALLLCIQTAAQDVTSPNHDPALNQSPATGQAQPNEQLPPSGAGKEPQPSTGKGDPNAIAAVIRIEGMIYDFVLDSLQRRVDRALEAGATMIVIELDTPGGMVTSALKIGKYIKALPVRTIAWVNNEAYSAGIMIGSACDELIMSASSATGDSAPVSMNKELAATERAKALSPIIEEFRDSATQNDYDYAMFHAMCVLGVEVYQVEHIESGRKQLVNQADYQMMVLAKSREEALAAVKPEGEQVSALTVGRVSVDVATDAEIGQWKLVKQVHDGATLLTLNQTRALEIGLSKATVKNHQELGDWLGGATVITINQSWSEDLAGWLIHPAIRAVLIVAVMVGAYMEFQAPGLGLPGAIALAALALLLGAPFLVDLSEIWHVLLVFIGIGLLMVELFITPGFAVFGILGLIFMFTGLILAIVPTSGPIGLPAKEMLNLLGMSVVWTLLGVITSTVCLIFLIRHMGWIPGLSRLVLHDRQEALLGGAMGTTSVGGSEVLGHGTIKLGDTGRVTAQLRPTGRAEINGQLIDVVSSGEWIEPDKPITVIEIHGNRIVVGPDT